MVTALRHDGSRYGADVRALVDAGLSIEPNQLWTFEQMSKLLGDRVEGSHQPLQEAIKRLARDHAIEFKNVRRVGYVRLDDAGIVQQAPTDRLGIGRKIKRAEQRTANIRDWDALADGYKREADAHRSVIALMRHVLKPASVRRIKLEVDRTHDQLDLDRTLALFRPKRPEE